MARKATGKKAAKAASKVLRDKRTSKASKTAAGSALSHVKKDRGNESSLIVAFSKTCDHESFL